jgi:gluconate 2-dehydrogenase gamma chain
MMSNDVDEHGSRRSFLRSALAMGVGSGTSFISIHQIQAAPNKGLSRQSVKPCLFLRPDELAFLSAAVDRFIPPDEEWPGAVEAGVVDYIDQQMAGKWGSAGYMYWHGPFKEGTPSQGYQLPFTPAELFRRATAAINRHFATRGTSFQALSGDEQDKFLSMLLANGMTLDGVLSKVFGDFLLQHTIEGFFADPIYGGNKGMIGWRMLGFPGPYADYYELIDQYGIKVDREPVSIAQSSHRHAM